MTRHVYIPSRHDPILRELHTRWKRTDQEIADQMGFSIDAIKNHRNALGLPINARADKPAYKETPRRPMVEKPNPVNQAVIQLGAKEKNGMYWLGNIPVSLNELMQRYNRWRVSRGLNQIVDNPLWRVEP